MRKVDSKGQKNVARLAVSQLKRSMIEKENQIRWFKKLGEPVVKQVSQLMEMQKEKKEWEKEYES